MNGVVLAGIVVGVVGIIVAVLLGIAAEAFKVEVDERVTAVRGELPGNNCGGCGYAGCDGLAAAIVAGNARVDQCPVGGAAVGQKIAAILGVEASMSERKVAYVKCAGTCDKAGNKYNYYGVDDCLKAVIVPGGGAKVCSYGCLGLGSCTRVCDFDSIAIVDGVAKVNTETCKACGNCANVCPKHLIDMIPYSATEKSIVVCSSHDKGKAVKDSCDAGCIGCGACKKQCEAGAIDIVNNLAVIDYDKCTGCGKCADKCPRNIILKK
ncbi:MAG: RnfABCDGE type electron transport complex subunit B [Lachnospiraceae bacterium]